MGIVATREDDYSWELPRTKRVDKGGNGQAVESAAAAGQAAPSLETSTTTASTGAGGNQGKHAEGTVDGLAGKGGGAADAAADGADVDDLKYPYPFYKLSLDEGGQKWKYPGVGWASSEKLTVEVCLVHHRHFLFTHVFTVWSSLTLLCIRTRDSGLASSFTCTKTACLTPARR